MPVSKLFCLPHEINVNLPTAIKNSMLVQQEADRSWVKDATAASHWYILILSTVTSILKLYLHTMSFTSLQYTPIHHPLVGSMSPL